MAQPTGKQECIRQSVRLDCPIEDAFRFFTEEFAQWWPLDLYSIGGHEAQTCGVEPWEGGRVFERTVSGEEHTWGVVRTWDPPERLTFSWDPGGLGNSGQSVDVEFSVEADGTRVTVIHSGWQAPSLAVCALEIDCTAMWSHLLADCLLGCLSKQLVVAA